MVPSIRCSDDQILDDESEGMRIVAHPNENITRHLSESRSSFNFEMLY